MAEPESTDFSRPLVWVGLDELPVLVANQMAIQFVAREEFLLSFGIVTPPLLLGEPEQVAAQAQQITFVEVKPVARVGFNRQRTEELIRLLQENLANHDRLFGEEETP